MPANTDPYQERYLIHQKKKQQQLKFCKGERKWEEIPVSIKDSFARLIKNRRTQRTFISETIADESLQFIYQAATLVPNSCNRQSIYLHPVTERNGKDLLSGILVGGVGWCHRSHVLLLIFADQTAYKAGNEIVFMPYLDAGVVIQQIYLAATAVNVGAGYINPNIREENIAFFNERFNPQQHLYCGAIALGKFDIKSEESPKRTWQEILI